MPELHESVAALWERREELSPRDLAAREVVQSVVEQLDHGELRTAEIDSTGEVVVHEWVKQAILLLFRVREMAVAEVGPFEFVDKLPLKSRFAERVEERLGRAALDALNGRDDQGRRGG